MASASLAACAKRQTDSFASLTSTHVTPSQSCLAALFLRPPKRGQQLGGEQDPQTTPLLVSVWLWCEWVQTRGDTHLREEAGTGVCMCREHVHECICTHCHVPIWAYAECVFMQIRVYVHVYMCVFGCRAALKA